VRTASEKSGFKTGLEALDDINYPRLDRGLYELENFVDRKKQLLPLLSQLITPQPATRV
jgi:hypothetical protein